jgi:hypothetical protein
VYHFAEIDASLEQLLAGKPPEVEEAVNILISSNFVPDGSVSDKNERAAFHHESDRCVCQNQNG